MYDVSVQGVYGKLNKWVNSLTSEVILMVNLRYKSWRKRNGRVGEKYQQTNEYTND